MGEILASLESCIDTSSTLTWGDILVRHSPQSILIHLKIPKVVSKEGEFVDIFKFPLFGCCPVAAMEALRSMQSQVGHLKASNSPFMLPSGKNLTTSTFNNCLRKLMADICREGIDTISGHSFRAGLPSAMARHPDLMSSDEVRGWGRWNSNAYECYTRLRLDQKEKIFEKIVTTLSQ
jgi:hypothetical protein